MYSRFSPNDLFVFLTPLSSQLFTMWINKLNVWLRLFFDLLQMLVFIRRGDILHFLFVVVTVNGRIREHTMCLK